MMSRRPEKTGNSILHPAERNMRRRLGETKELTRKRGWNHKQLQQERNQNHPVEQKWKVLNQICMAR